MRCVWFVLAAVLCSAALSVAAEGEAAESVASAAEDARVEKEAKRLLDAANATLSEAKKLADQAKKQAENLQAESQQAKGKVEEVSKEADKLNTSTQPEVSGVEGNDAQAVMKTLGQPLKTAMSTVDALRQNAFIAGGIANAAMQSVYHSMKACRCLWEMLKSRSMRPFLTRKRQSANLQTRSTTRPVST
ncbi:hypothetical protein DQ04_06471040 [Trypanosoma grayi]|uniref:hypothetical protein n=1 Tax=Trypanosoma grayi TaxID=71804 RepID=UPI0004F4BE1D|nr:hypothetical protein DQ04_06471040 [Trypanosoma grayi]KEG08775.1 hypothetical protein DQ04_06471040 [Trypanosoma grayi]